MILATAEDCGTLEIVRRSGLSKPVVWRWQERFMHEGVDGLLRDKTRPPGKRPLPGETVGRVVNLTLTSSPRDGSSVGCSALSSTSRPPSTTISPSTTTNPSPSSGRQTQNASWLLSNAGSKR